MAATAIEKLDKRTYGISEQQFRNTFEKVSTLPGITGHNLPGQGSPTDVDA